MDVRIETTARELAIQYGALSLDDLIGWADGKIENEATPDTRYFDISLAKSMDDVISALNSFGPSNDKTSVAKLTFRFFYESLNSGKGDFQKIARGIYDMATNGYLPDPEVEGEMWSYWDSLDLAIDGIFGDPDEIRSEILQFLHKYQG